MKNTYIEVDVEKINDYPIAPINISEIKIYSEFQSLIVDGMKYDTWLRLHYLKNYELNNAIDKIIDFYEKLSFVDSTTYNSDGFLEVFYHNNKRIKYNIRFEKNYLASKKRYSKKKMAEIRVKEILHTLKCKRVFSESKKCGRVSMPVKDLYQIVKKLEDKSMTREYKCNLVSYFIMPDKVPSNYFYNFDKLLKRLKKETNAN